MLVGLTNDEKESLRNMEICWMFDSSNLTVAQVARHFGMSTEEVKKVLMDDAFKGETK